MAKWRSIKTAPKDGTFILLGDNRYKEPAYLHAHWDDGFNAWCTKASRDGTLSYWRDATHWMQIPKLPEAA